MADLDELVRSYRALLELLRGATRGEQGGEIFERDLEIRRDEYHRCVLGALGACAGQEDHDAVATVLARHLLDYPPLAEDPVTGDLQALAESLVEPGTGVAEAGTGARLLSVLVRLRELRSLIPVPVASQPAPRVASLEELLEGWPERPSQGTRDLLHRAMVEVHKGRRGDRRTRHRAASARIDLAVATSWEPYHPWRLALLERARELAPDLADASFQVARHLKAYGELAGARQACRRAVDLEPSAPEPLVLLATLLEFAARPREALDAYERVLRLRERQSGVMRGGPEAGRARRSLSGRFRRPEVGLARATQGALEGCARLRAMLGNPAGALRAMVEVSRSVPAETRQLRGLRGLAAHVGNQALRQRVDAELARRGAAPGGVMPAAFAGVDRVELERLLQGLDWP